MGWLEDVRIYPGDLLVNSKIDTGAKTSSLNKIGSCLGGVYKLSKVNLIDRGGLKYPLLISREFLQQTYIVDPGRTFISTPACEQPSNNPNENGGESARLQ